MREDRSPSVLLRESTGRVESKLETGRKEPAECFTML